MVRLLIFVSTVAVLASPALAQGGQIAVFSDPTGSSCSSSYVHLSAPGLVNLYVIHVWHSGATAVRFAATRPVCFTAIWLSDTPAFPGQVGNSQTGTTVSYGTCLPAPVLVLTMTFYSYGTTPSCCYYRVTPDPTAPSGQVEAWNCASNRVYVTGGLAILNPTPGCAILGCPVPAETTTWGSVKALFFD